MTFWDINLNITDIQKVVCSKNFRTTIVEFECFHSRLLAATKSYSGQNPFEDDMSSEDVSAPSTDDEKLAGHETEGKMESNPVEKGPLASSAEVSKSNQGNAEIQDEKAATQDQGTQLNEIKQSNDEEKNASDESVPNNEPIISELLAKMGLKDEDVERMLGTEESWESKVNQQALEKKEESLSILAQLGISEDDSNALLDQSEVWEVKLDKDVAERRQDIAEICQNLGLESDPGKDLEYEEAWEKKAETERVNGWNTPATQTNTSNTAAISQTISDWLNSFTRMVSEAKFY